MAILKSVAAHVVETRPSINPFFPEGATHASQRDKRKGPRVLSTEQISFVSSGTPEADAAAEALRHRYGDVGFDNAGVVVALGGDGLMLQSLHRKMGQHVPVYGMNFGSVGFLMNDYSAEDLVDRLAAAKPTHI